MARCASCCMCGVATSTTPNPDPNPNRNPDPNPEPDPNPNQVRRGDVYYLGPKTGRPHPHYVESGALQLELTLPLPLALSLSRARSLTLALALIRRGARGAGRCARGRGRAGVPSCTPYYDYTVCIRTALHTHCICTAYRRGRAWSSMWRPSAAGCTTTHARCARCCPARVRGRVRDRVRVRVRVRAPGLLTVALLTVALLTVALLATH